MKIYKIIKQGKINLSKLILIIFKYINNLLKNHLQLVLEINERKKMIIIILNQIINCQHLKLNHQLENIV